MDTDERYLAMCALLGDMIFKMHKAGIAINKDTMLQQLLILFDEDETFDKAYYQAMIRIFL